MSEFKHPAVRICLVLLAISVAAMLYFYNQGYDQSIGWTLNTESDLEGIVAHQFQKGPFEFQILAEKIVLQEAFFGGPIEDLLIIRIVAFGLVLLGLALLTASATYLKQIGFLIYSGLMIFFLIQLHLEEFLSAEKWIVLVPIGLLIGPAFYFQSYRSHATYLQRLVVISVSFVLAVFLIPASVGDFSVYFFANGILPLTILAFLFFAVIAEEILFGMLFILTKNRGGQNNHLHLIFIGGIYLANLAGFYLNKAGIIDFTFTFMNPLVLMILSTGVAMWSLQYKKSMIGSFHFVPAIIMVLGGGMITFTLFAFSFAQGLDALYEGFQYLIIYAHLGFGFFFFAYIIVNFIDPLSRGLMVYKVIFKPQTFHYGTARLAGMAAVCAFYFLSSNLPYNMARAARYSLLGDVEYAKNETELALTYYRYADFYGFNTHYPNYQMAGIYLDLGKATEARHHYEKASRRYPSAQAILNSSNLQNSTDLTQSKVILQSGLQQFPGSPELQNNLGIINWKNGLTEQAYESFKNSKSRQEWNRAPEANKWGVLSELRQIRDENPTEDFNSGNLVVKANVLSAMLSAGEFSELPFDSAEVSSNPYPLHRQAYLLNSLYYQSDSTIYPLVDREFGTTYQGVQQEMRKALAINLYLTGRIKSAFRYLDQLQLSKSGRESGELLNEMGLMALDQGAPKEARDFFTQALEKGFEPARFNRLVSFLEDQDFKNARIQLAELIAKDSLHAPLQSALTNVFEPGTDTTAEAKFNQLYYRFNNYSPREIREQLVLFDPENQQKVVDRIAEYCLRSDVPISNFEIQLEFPNLEVYDSAKLVSLAYESPFDVRIILEAVKRLNDPIEAYNLLNESLEFNPYSIPLLKAQAMSAIDINLPEYARNTLIALSNLMSPIQYLEFEKAWYQKKAEAEKPWPY